MRGSSLAVVEPMNTANIEDLIIKGDLKSLTPEKRARYYVEVCHSVGLNPMTQPFEYITLNGKLTLYAKKGATDQLRGIHNIGITIDRTEVVNDIYTVTVTGRDATGRTDSDIGAVTIKSLQGDNLANAMMKAITKAKRRVTMSMCGLGMLDETEVETIPTARAVRVNHDTGEILDSTPAPVAANVETGEIIDADYTYDEENVPPPAPRIVSSERKDAPTEKQMKFLGVLISKMGWDDATGKATLKQRYNITSRSQLTYAQGKDLIDWLVAEVEKKEKGEEFNDGMPY